MPQLERGGSCRLLRKWCDVATFPASTGVGGKKFQSAQYLRLHNDSRNMLCGACHGGRWPNDASRQLRCSWQLASLKLSAPKTTSSCTQGCGAEQSNYAYAHRSPSRNFATKGWSEQQKALSQVIRITSWNMTQSKSEECLCAGTAKVWPLTMRQPRKLQSIYYGYFRP